MNFIFGYYEEGRAPFQRFYRSVFHLDFLISKTRPDNNKKWTKSSKNPSLSWFIDQWFSKVFFFWLLFLHFSFCSCSFFPRIFSGELFTVAVRVYSFFLLLMCVFFLRRRQLRLVRAPRSESFVAHLLKSQKYLKSFRVLAPQWHFIIKNCCCCCFYVSVALLLVVTEAYLNIFGHANKAKLMFGSQLISTICECLSLSVSMCVCRMIFSFVPHCCWWVLSLSWT